MEDREFVLLTEKEKEEKIGKIRCVNEQIDEILMEHCVSLDDIDDSDDVLDENYYNSVDFDLEILYAEKEELENDLFRNEYYERQGGKESSKTRDKDIGRVLGDGLPECDLLNREGKALQVARYICNESSKTPFNIGVIGEWGTGKSSFLNLINLKMKEIDSDCNVVDVFYDASSYSDQSQIWSNFAKILFEKYEQERMFSHLRFAFAKMKKNKKRVLSEIALNVFFVFLIFLLTWGGKYAFSAESLIGKFTGYGLSLTGIIVLVTQVIIPWGKGLLESTIPLSKKVLNGLRLPSYSEVLGTREQVAKEINILFEVWMPKDNQKLVIFVDELDRCSEKGVTEFFQAIQLFYSTKKIIFVFAIEYSHLKRSLVKSQNVPVDEIDMYAVRYLDKYVSVVVSMDEKIDYSELAERLIKEEGAAGKIQITEEETEEIKKCLSYVPSNFLTPRIVKKVINLMILSKTFRMNCNSEIKIKYSELFAWIIFRTFYTDAADYIANLYVGEKEYAPLKEILKNVSYSKNVQVKTNNHEYMEIIKEFIMKDIGIYNGLAHEFRLLE